MKLRVSVIISQLFQVILPAKIYSKYPRIKIGISGVKVREKKKKENLSLYLHFFHITANLKHIILCRGKDEIGSKRYKNKKCACKACKTIVFYC